MEKADLQKYLDFTLSNQDVTKSKPDPEIYLKSMAALGVTPDETFIFEDSQVGIDAAKASGASYMIVSPNQFE